MTQRRGRKAPRSFPRHGVRHVTHAFNISRRGLLAMAGAGLASATLPAALFAQQGRNILIIASGQDIPNFDPHVASGYSASFLMRNVYDPLVRVAGDIAHELDADPVTAEHVVRAKQIARPLEQQVVDRYVERRRDYKTYITEGAHVGMVNGLAVMGADSGLSEMSGILMPIVAEVTPAASRSEGRTFATGKLGEIAKEAVQNVSALVKKYTGEDISKYDIHVQFVGAYDGVEGDSASVSIAAAVISALEEAEVDQSIALKGSLAVRGQVLPVGGVNAKIEDAAEAGIRKVLIPEANMQDVLLESRYRGKIEVVPVATLQDVLDNILVPGPSKESLLEKLALARFLPGKFPGLPSAA